MIKENIKKWHDLIKGDYPGGFDELLDNDVNFYSPIVFSAKRKRAYNFISYGSWKYIWW